MLSVTVDNKPVVIVGDVSKFVPFSPNRFSCIELDDNAGTIKIHLPKITHSNLELNTDEYDLLFCKGKSYSSKKMFFEVNIFVNT
jgi:hypothetical protein